MHLSFFQMQLIFRVQVIPTYNDDHNICSDSPLCLEYDIDRDSFLF